MTTEIANENLHIALGSLQAIHDRLEDFLRLVDPARQSNTALDRLVSSASVKGNQARLFGLTGYNNGASQFLHIYDLADLPRDGAPPTVVLPIAAASGFSLDYGLRGRHFVNGIVIAASTTAATKTLPSTKDLWLDVQYD